MELITGIQQVGIGVTDANKAKYFYKEYFDMSVKVFEDKAAATLMANYTGGEVHQRHAILSLNIAGGGGFEIWQFISRQPKPPAAKMALGQPGIFAVKIKTKHIEEAYRFFQQKHGVNLTAIYSSIDKRKHFWLTDEGGNWFNIIECDDWFKSPTAHCGGVLGAVLGVSDMEKAVQFYSDVLGINEQVYNIKSTITDMPGVESTGTIYHRVLLRQKTSTIGAFSKLLGGFEIELVQAIAQNNLEHTYHNRFWGDCGFIHLCFDVPDMNALKAKAATAGYLFTVDSENSFAMENAAGRFCYVEDPDGTLIELVETHKVPIVKKLGWHINLKKRKHKKPLPNWVIGLMKISKI
jgi:catechol 2,3-dioxygenase-like lactoylglutathione lyase family enzyme